MIVLLAITILSLAVATIASVVAWRIAREEQRRSEARVDALAADIFEADTDDEEPLRVAVNTLFAEARSETPSRFYAAIVMGGVVVGSALAAVVLATAAFRDEVDEPSAGAAAGPAVLTELEPLELAALDHEREMDGLVIRGLVRDPGRSHAGDSLVAVIFAVDREGVVVGSGRAPVEIAAGPTETGVESSFVVRITGVGDIRRYRVSFRNGERTIAHVDRRAQSMTAQLP